MVSIRRDLWRTSSPIPVLKKAYLEQAVQDCVQVGFEYFQRRRVHNFSGQPVLVLWHPQTKKVFPHVLVFQFVEPLNLVLLLDITEKRLAPFF